MEEINQEIKSIAVGYTKEDAYKSLEIINAWISNIDTKTSFGLAFVGILMGFIFNKGIADSFNILGNSTNIVELNVESVILVMLVGVLYIVSFVSIGSFLFVLIARVKNIYNDII